MITQKEKQLGSLFAKLAAIGVAANFVVGIVLIGLTVLDTAQLTDHYNLLLGL